MRLLPHFEREPFGANEYLDVILRRPFMGDNRLSRSGAFPDPTCSCSTGR